MTLWFEQHRRETMGAPKNKDTSLTGLNKIFSGFEKPIIKASQLHGIEYSSLIFELGNRKLVAGQEDLILQIAENIKKTTVKV